MLQIIKTGCNMPNYFEYPEIPGKQHFTCDRYHAAISIDACSLNWKAANIHNSELRAKCKSCSVGASHAGAIDTNMSPFRGSQICARCHKTTNRLIGKSSACSICVSCYNRQREMLIGKNAKGTAPVKLQALYPRSIRVQVGCDTKTVSAPLSVDTEELIIGVLRNAIQSVKFSFLGRPAGLHSQLRLF